MELGIAHVDNQTTYIIDVVTRTSPAAIVPSLSSAMLWASTINQEEMLSKGLPSVYACKVVSDNNLLFASRKTVCTYHKAPDCLLYWDL